MRLKSTKDKVQKQLRFFPDEWKRIEAKCNIDGLSYQKIGELLFGAYVKDNKELRKIIEKYIEQHGVKKKRGSFDEIEVKELYRLLETEYSPLRDLEDAKKEIELENEE